MGRGRRISNDLREAIVHMSEDLSNKTIARYTGVSLRSVQRIVAAARAEPGSETAQKQRAAAKARVMTDDIIQVSRCTVLRY